ncbi:MAG TPA: radical SAM/Cys-rich domain protein [Nitrospirae bacterium]|nr:antilisterial bacteriocin subtilosin biosynthesis protein AlbA [bacterium BMS3Abin06]HDH11944.1 radical SAM/Cys-rich domain protein [Nitrospirota bacterium]HDZ01990.1 radical SAM/Cys-rich domain protein [Nitrospirota bacterium]
MNAFDKKLLSTRAYPLRAKDISAIQVNMGYKCNLRCTHCHIDASPDRTEMMLSSTVDKIIDILQKQAEITSLDITGGSPEYNPDFNRLVKSASAMGKKVMVRSNLAIYTEEGMEDIPSFLADNKVKIIASLPCYTEEGVDGQRGKGTYKKVILVLKHLNKLGYGQGNSDLEIDIMFNPGKEGIAPDQQMLENAYKEKLKEMHGITFNNLIALSNMPIGRFGKSISGEERTEYLLRLEEKYNPQTVENLMCRHLISVSPDGKIYDCDFWQVLNLPVKNGSSRIEDFDYSNLKNREIVTNPFCFMCTAGAGASCSGALA